jgi:Family of unknown function (DUF6790)
MFALVLPALALIGAAVHLIVTKAPRTRERVAEVLLLYLLVIGVGATGIFAFMGHAFRAEQVAEQIGFPPDNPFQLEVAVANLSYGVLGILCMWLRGGFWTATAIGNAIYLWGAAWGHVHELVEHDNHSAYNSGAILYTDIFVPLAILLLLVYVRRSGRAQSEGALAGV